MRNLFQNYLAWAKTWSKSQVIFLTVIVIALGATALWATYRYSQAYDVIQTLNHQKP